MRLIIFALMIIVFAIFIVGWLDNPAYSDEIVVFEWEPLSSYMDETDETTMCTDDECLRCR